MSWWRLKNPGLFLPTWHQLMREGEGQHAAGTYYSETHARRAQRDWQLFQYCLRGYPAHPTHHFLHGYERRSQVRFDENINKWVLWIKVNREFKTLWDEAEVIEK